MKDIENLPGEEWKIIPETNNKYFISNFGRCASYRGNLLKISKAKSGTLYLKLFIDGKHKSKYIYRTMYLVFMDSNLSDDYTVLLKKDMPLHVSNLYIVKRDKVSRETHGKQVYVYDMDTTFMGKCNSAAEAAEKYNAYSRGTVSRVCRGDNTHANYYIFSYTKLEYSDLINRINAAILSSFVACHRYANSGKKSHETFIDYEYSNVGIISRITVKRIFHYKRTAKNKIIELTFDPKDWVKHDSAFNRHLPRPMGDLPQGGYEVDVSKYSRLYLDEVYVYDGRNGTYLFKDSLYNIAIKYNVSFESVRYPVRLQKEDSTKLNYTILDKYPYLLLINKDDSLAWDYVYNNPAPFGKDKIIYKRYMGIKARCYNKESTRYNYYGAKGITMFVDWLNDFREFEFFLKSLGFKKDLEIDRINPKFGYEPWNIQLIPHKDNTIKMFYDNRRSAIQIKLDDLKYYRRKHNFFKTYKKGRFMCDKL